MRRLAFLSLGLLFAGAAYAETISTTVLYPAGSDEAAALRSIQIEPFGGDAGADLTVQIEDSLRQAEDGTGRYFQIIPAATGRGGEALLRGSAQTEVRYSDYSEEHDRCIKDAKGACTAAREKVMVRCTKRQVELVVALRLIATDGTLLWSDNRPENYQDNYCEDAETSPKSRNAIARELNGRVAVRIRQDFVPRIAVENIRVDENRKGLSKVDSEAFKQAVKLTKSDVKRACKIWLDLADRNRGHAPSQFNTGLCWEAAPDTGDNADLYYTRALAANPRHSAALRGKDRLAAAKRALVQAERHQRP